MKLQEGIRRKPWLVLAVLAAILLGCVAVSLCIGKYSVQVGDIIRIVLGKIFGFEGDWTSMTENVVLRLRLPRILAAVIVGASLSLSGAVYQGIFQNPLVSPDFLGVSSGACIGAAVAILSSFSAGGIQLLRFWAGLARCF